jgi:N-acetylglutamate synthase-like GNAT family acetyltransferase
MTNTNEEVAGYKISTDPSLLDVKMIHNFLTNSYWAKKIPYSFVKKSIENSLCFGIYKEECQIGFARIISDFATFAYLADVFILEEHRGKGLSKRLMDCILKHPDLQNLRRWMLVTRDAHALYRNYGFENVQKPETYMEFLNRDVYESLSEKSEDSTLPGAGNEKNDTSDNQQAS